MESQVKVKITIVYMYVRHRYIDLGGGGGDFSSLQSHFSQGIGLHMPVIVHLYGDLTCF